MDRRLVSWKGEHIENLIKVWGPPTSQTDAPRKQYLWRQQGVASAPGGLHSYGPVTYMSTGSSWNVECIRTVETDAKGLVDTLTLQGDCAWFNLHYQHFEGNPKIMPPMKRYM